jgi:hypothetical protein
MQSPLGILSLPLFAPVIMHSLGALIRRGSVSRSALHPAGREEERKRERSAGYGRRSFIPPGFFIQFFWFWPPAWFTVSSGLGGVLPSYLPAPTLGLPIPLTVCRCSEGVLFACRELERFSSRVLRDIQRLKNYWALHS